MPLIAAAVPSAGTKFLQGYSAIAYKFEKDVHATYVLNEMQVSGELRWWSYTSHFASLLALISLPQ